jgi:hypothetical protein
MKNKAKKSKDYLPNFRIKKSNSKEDLSQENKKAKLQNSLRLRSKSTEDPSASNSRTFLEKKRIRKNDSSDECEKEQLKSSKKKKRNSFNIKNVSFPESPVGNLRNTMDESILSKNIKPNPKNPKSDFLLPPKPAYAQKIPNSEGLSGNKPTKPSESIIKTKGILLENNNRHHHRNASDLFMGKSHFRKISSDFNGILPLARTDVSQSPKSTYSVKKH